MTYDLAGWLGSRLLAALQKAETSSQPGHTHPATDLSDSSATGRSLITATDAAAARATLGLGDSATRNVGTAAGTVAAGDDSRLSDARTPTAHGHPLSDLAQSGATTGQVAAWNGSAWAPTTPSGGSPAGSGTEVQYRDGASFGAMSGTAWNNAARALTITGAMVTANAPVLRLSQTWNNGAAVFQGFEISITNTASAAGSCPARVLMGGSSAFEVRAISATSAAVVINGGSTSNQIHIGNHVAGDGYPGIWMGVASTSYTNFAFLVDTSVGGAIFNGVNNAQFRISNNTNFQVVSGQVRVASNASFGFSSSGAGPFGLTAAADVVLNRDAANILAQRNGTAAQTFRAYNTFTDASNGEWLSIGWASNLCTIAPTANGTGTVRQLIVRHPPVAVSALPAAATAGAGARTMVNDANATTFHSIVAGGGSNTVPVFSDGTNWRIG